MVQTSEWPEYIDSSLVKILADSREELRGLNSIGFIERLRTQDFECDQRNMGLAVRFALNRIDVLSGNELGYKLSTKTLGLPVIILYEFIAKFFMADRGLFDSLWKEYNILQHNKYTFCQTPKNIKDCLTRSKDEPIEDGLLFLGLRTDKMLQNGRIMYGEEVVYSKDRSVKIIDAEKKSWLKMFVERAGDVYKASLMLGRFQHLLYNANCLKEELSDGNPPIGDYLQPALIFKLCNRDFEKYAPHVGLDLGDYSLFKKISF